MTTEIETGASRTDAAVLDLLRTSLAIWAVEATVARQSDGTIAIRREGPELRVTRAPSSLPFRWLVASDGRERAASSVAGLLRLVRGAVDASWKPGRARIATLMPPAEP